MFASILDYDFLKALSMLFILCIAFVSKVSLAQILSSVIQLIVLKHSFLSFLFQAALNICLRPQLFNTIWYRLYLLLCGLIALSYWDFIFILIVWRWNIASIRGTLNSFCQTFNCFCHAWCNWRFQQDILTCIEKFQNDSNLYQFLDQYLYSLISSMLLVLMEIHALISFSNFLFFGKSACVDSHQE